VSPNEWLLGTIGLDGYFGFRPIKITKSQLNQSARYQELLKRRAQQWAASKKPAKFQKPKYSERDYDLLVTALMSPEKALPDLTFVPDNLSADIVSTYLNISYYLYSVQPATKISKGFLGREIEPPSSDKMRFVWACNAIDSIEFVLNLLDQGALTPAEANAFTSIYPDVAADTAVAYLKEAVNYMYDNEKPTMASWQLQGISALLGAPVADFNDVMQWQSGYEQQGAGRPPETKSPNIAQFNMSDMQDLSTQT
jgi:hypothetical protein